jgi:D-tyrosyl-tRNA(Tyr) deacylase
MRAVLQRVSRARVLVDGRPTGAIQNGFLILAGIGAEDTDADLDLVADKIVHLRVFPDDEGKMNRSIQDVAGAALVVSQFTLHADCRRGRRPGFTRAAPGEKAAAMIEAFVELLRRKGLRVETGVFGAMMDVELVNTGPVTILLDSVELRPSGVE